MKSWWVALLLIAGCASAPEMSDRSGELNKWTDPDLQVVLDAQDRRDVDVLCRSLEHPKMEVRRQAAMAFASVVLAKGPNACRCIISALQDPSPEVRRAAVLASGFAGDSTFTVHMAEMAMAEKDTAVQRAYFSASFIAMQRHRMLNTQAILYMLEKGDINDRTRAADALRRFEDTTIQKLGNEIHEMLGTQSPEVRQFLILALRKLNDPADLPMLRETVVTTAASPGERVNALRVLGRMQPDADLFLRAIDDPTLSQAAIEQLQQMETIDGRMLFERAMNVTDARTKTMLLGLAIKHGDDDVRSRAMKEIELLRQHRSAYVRAEAIAAIAQHESDAVMQDLRNVLSSNASAVERQVAFLGAVKQVRDRMARSRFASVEAQYRELGEVIRAAVTTKDAGLISAAAEELLKEEGEAIRVMLDEKQLKETLSLLTSIEDLEARILLHKLLGHFDLYTMHGHDLPYNHPIDMDRLVALPQGQRYRIVTTKGEIIIGTDVHAAPSTSLAFDSLVTSGFYNGKAFHRVVPNFVVQTGCPRGDGYGGMPWTLRTEISDRLFQAGSVGMASAGPDTEGSQFFITHSSTPHLDGRYTNFGEVFGGMDVVWRLQVGDVIERIERIP